MKNEWDLSNPASSVEASDELYGRILQRMKEEKNKSIQNQRNLMVVGGLLLILMGINFFVSQSEKVVSTDKVEVLYNEYVMSNIDY